MALLTRNLIFATFLCLTNSAFGLGFHGIGDLAGGSYESFARAVSGDGTTVVGGSRSASGFEAFRWTLSGGIEGLGDLPGGDFYSNAEDVSYDGSVIVGTATYTPPITASNGSTAFRWTSQNQSMQNLCTVCIASSAFGVSADGSVVVGTQNQATFEPYFAFRWEGSRTNIGRPPHARFHSAYSVSADGNVVVGTGDTFSTHSPEAVQWIPGGVEGIISGLGGLSLNASSEAYAVSADGMVIVGESDNQAFRHGPGPMVGLGDLPGGSFRSSAYGVSGDGSVVVGESDSSLGPSAFIWTELGGMQDLNVYLPTLGLDLTGWYLTRAEDISDDGSVIVGLGRNPAGQTEGWIAIMTIPEPKTATLVLATALLFAIPRRPKGNQP